MKKRSSTLVECGSWFLIVQLLLAFVPSLAQPSEEVHLVPQIGHTGAMLNGEMHRNGKWLATFGMDDNVLVWDMEAMKVFRRFGLHDGSILHGGELQFLYKQDRPYLITMGSEQYFLALWDVLGDSLQTIINMPEGVHPKRVSRVIWDEQESVMVCGHSKVLIMNPFTGEVLKKWRVPKKWMDGDYPKKTSLPSIEVMLEKRLYPLSGSPRVALRNKQQLLVYNLETDEVEQKLNLPSAMISMAYHHQSSQMAVLYEGAMDILDMLDGYKPMAQRHVFTENTAKGAKMRFSHGGNSVFVWQSRDSATLYNIKDRHQDYSWAGHPSNIPFDLFFDEIKGERIELRKTAPNRYINAGAEYTLPTSPSTFQFLPSKMATCASGQWLFFQAKTSTTDFGLYRFDRSSLEVKRMRSMNETNYYQYLTAAKHSDQLAGFTKDGYLHLLSASGKLLSSFSVESRCKEEWGEGQIRALTMANDGSTTAFSYNTDDVSILLIMEKDATELKTISISTKKDELKSIGEIEIGKNGDLIFLRGGERFDIFQKNTDSVIVGRKCTKDEFIYQGMKVLSDSTVALYTRDQHLIIYNFLKHEDEKDIPLQFTPYLEGIVPLEDSLLLMVSNWEAAGLCQLVNLSTGHARWFDTGHRDDVVAYCKLDEDLMATASLIGGIRFTHFPDLKNDVRLFLSGDKPFFTSEDSMYASPGTVLELLNFTIGEHSFNPSLFELNYNRHDEILKRIGKNATMKINWYNALYQKRLSNATGARSLESISSSLSVEIDEKINLLHRDRLAEIHFVAKTKDSNPISLFVYINGFPIEARTGIELRPNTSGVCDTVIRFELDAMNNHIEYFVRDQEQYESVHRFANLYLLDRNTGGRETHTFLVVLSVSKYVESEYNLKYAVKDGNDLLKGFQDQYAGYTFHTMSLFDEQVVRSSLDSLERFLGHIKSNDRLIVFFSGHGLLDSGMNLFLATHDVDFNDPGEKGIAYDSLENIMMNCASRSKLFMIDACHSGLVDEELRSSPSMSSELTTGEFPGMRGARTRKFAFSDEMVSFEQMRKLYSDLRGYNGVNVFAAAGGTDYALESDLWGNGAFTKAILELFDNGCELADQRGYWGMPLSMFFNDLSQRVVELTKGKQVPVCRNEIGKDFWILDCGDFDSLITD